MQTLLKALSIDGQTQGAGTGQWLDCDGPPLTSISPVTGAPLGTVHTAGPVQVETVIDAAKTAFDQWRQVPAPRRGEIIRQIGDALRRNKTELGALVSLEVGKIRAEAEGEIQEMIDTADMAVGQSRMLYGVAMHSERPGHRMYEQWHPLGPVGVITAFNFPAAVWGWNSLIAMACGNPLIWKPSSKAPLTAMAICSVYWQVLAANGMPEGVVSLLIGDRQAVGDPMIRDARIPLVSATGSVAMGRKVAQAVAGRLGRSLLELGGNNGIIVTPNADLDLAVPAIVFGAVGTAGQRCTTTRRIIVHEQLYGELSQQLIDAYRQVPIGNPQEDGVLMGPLIDQDAVAAMQKALEEIKAQGGRILFGGTVLAGKGYEAGTYVTPCLCEASADMPIVRQETFAPILYLIRYRHFDEAVAIHNSVPQGLSSAVFTTDLREAEQFLSATGSDCGIANVNIGTSGAEIGGAFGGEKDTGGGRESGSDAWKAYMRRQTCTINWSRDLPLAQGIQFRIGAAAGRPGT